MSVDYKTMIKSTIRFKIFPIKDSDINRKHKKICYYYYICIKKNECM